jgi:hypothetical protein
VKKTADILALLAIFACTAIYCAIFFGGYEAIGDGNDYAALARSIIRGEGFLLGHIYPLGLVFDPTVPQPNNIWAPGYPVYLAIWFSLLGADDSVALAASIFAVWLLVAGGYILGRLLGGRFMALMTAALLGLSQIVLYSAIEGTPEILAGAMMTFSILLIINHPSKLKILISGGLFGIAVLTRYQLAFVAVPFALIFFNRALGRKGIWALSALIVILPWLIRNWLVLGNPFFTLQAYGEFTKGMGRFKDYYFTYRSFIPMSLLSTLTHFPLDMAKKVVGGLVFFAGAFPLRFNFLGLVPYFYSIMKVRQVLSVERKAILFSVSSAILIALLSSIDGHHDRHLLPLQALLIISMLVGLRYLLQEMSLTKYRIAVIISGALLFLPARAPFLEMRLHGIAENSRANQPGYAMLGKFTEPDDVIVSDASDAVWWYGERNSIWIPAAYDDLRLLISQGPCDFIYLVDNSSFINSLGDTQLADFVGSVEAVESFLGPGELYKVIADRNIPDSYALR